MAIALVFDFPGATKLHYDQVCEHMGLGDHMAPGGLHHAAGTYGDGWRVIDVWESFEHFSRFRTGQLEPGAQAVGLELPDVRLVEVDEMRPGNHERPEIVQCVIMPGLDRDAFHAADAEILPGGTVPEALTWHVNGPYEGGWCVIDGWTSQRARDDFIESRVRPAFEHAPLQGPPTIEDLIVEATLTAGTRAPA